MAKKKKIKGFAMPVISKEYDTIFVRVPKTASTSIKFWLEKNIKAKQYKKDHSSYNESVRMYGNFNFSFSVVRNPYARLVSLYNYTRKRLENNEVEIITPERIKSLPEKKQGRFTQSMHRQQAYLSGLSSIIDFTINNKTIDTYFRSQTEYVDGCKHILKFENLEQDFKFIQNYFNCYEPLDFMNVGKTVDYRTYFDDELLEKVTPMLQKDLDKFNYTF